MCSILFQNYGIYWFYFIKQMMVTNKSLKQTAKFLGIRFFFFFVW